MILRWGRIRCVLLVCLAWSSAAATQSWAQNSSLLSRSTQRRPLTLQDYSWTYQAALEPNKFEANDLITILVKTRSTVISEAETDRKKKAHATAILKDWVLLKGLTKIVPDPQSAGDPTVAASLDNKMKSEGGFESLDSISFTIACRVIEIRPNGNLILEGRRTIENNNEMWNQALTGEVRPEDVQPNNTVLSENVADLRIRKWEAGSVRDSYRRGWFLRWLDMYQPW